MLYLISKKKMVFLFTFSIFISLAATCAFAATHIFNTSDSPFAPGSSNQGWWSDQAISSSTMNYNYTAGKAQGSIFRNFFTFDLKSLALTGKTITSAKLEITKNTCAASSPTVNYVLRDVATDAALLNNNVGLNPAIYQDLGTGVVYGSYDVAISGSGSTVLTFNLNAAALQDIASAAGGWFSVGGSVDNMGAGSSEYLFAFTSQGGIQRLTVETVPEPSSITALLGGLAGLIGFRRRKA